MLFYLNMGYISAIGKILEASEVKIIKTDGNLGQFIVNTNSPESSSLEFARAAATSIQAHGIDINIDDSHLLLRSIRKKRIKSKFAKNNIEDGDVDDPEVDEATREEGPPNDTKHQRIINAHIARLAQKNADISIVKKIFGG